MVRLTVSVDPPPLTVSFSWFYLVFFWPYIMKIALFLWKIHFRTHMFIIWGQKYNPKNHEKLTLRWERGGGSTLTVSLTRKYQFFTTPPSNVFQVALCTLYIYWIINLSWGNSYDVNSPETSFTILLHLSGQPAFSLNNFCIGELIDSFMRRALAYIHNLQEASNLWHLTVENGCSFPTKIE